MNNRTKQAVITEYLGGQTTHRQLAKKYKIGRATVCRLLQAHHGIKPGRLPSKDILILPEMVQEIRNDLPTDVVELRWQLEQERIRIKLLTTIIEIAETELKIPIRKKFGTKL